MSHSNRATLSIVPRQPIRPLWILAASIAALIPTARATDAIKTWDAGGNNNFYNTTNWNPDGTPTFTGNTDAIVFDGAQAAGNPTIALNITGGLTSYLVKSFTFGSAPLSNTYTFAYTFNGPQSLILGDATTTSTQANTGFLTNNSSGTQTFNLASNANTVLPFQIGFTFGGINAAVGNFVFGANAKIDIGNESNAAGRDVVVTGTGNTTINGVLSGLGDDTSAGGTLTKTGAGTLFLSGDSTTWNGRITITNGTVQVNKTNSLGTAAGRTTISGGTADGRLAITGGINLAEPLFLGGRSSATAPHIVNVSGSNTLVTGPVTLEAGGAEYGFQSDGGTLQVQSSIAYGTGVGGTTLNLRGVGNGVIASNLPAQAISIVKEGTGTWTLSGPANAQTGSLTVNGGRLNVQTTQTGGGALAVNTGGTLGVTLSAAGQTLNAGGLTLGSGSTLALDLGSFGNPVGAILNTTSLAVSTASTIILKAGGLSIGQFPLIDYSGTIGGDGFAGLTLGTLPARVTANLSNDSVDTRILLNVTAFDIPRWTGGTNGDWDIDDGSGIGTENWKEALSGNTTRYLQGGGGIDSVLFDDTAGVPTTVNLTATLSPSSVTVNTSANAFVFSGIGKLSGPTGLLKQGTSTLTLLNTGGNDYTGTTTIAAGTLQLGDGTTAGAGQLGTGSIVNAGTLVINRPDALTFGGDISGAGALVKRGAGALTVSGNNSSYIGAVTVEAGTLKLGSINALAAPTSVAVQSGAVLDVNGRAVNSTVTIGGSGIGGTGALVNTGTGSATSGVNRLVLSEDATLGGTGRFDVTGPLNAAGHNLIKVGTNTIFLNGSGETHLANIVINAGRLSISGNTTLGDQPGVVTVQGAEFAFEDSTVPATKSVQLNGGKILFPTGDLNVLQAGISLLDADPITLNPVVNTFQGAGTLTVSGVVSGLGGITKTNAGALILTGNNTYAGVTSITGGVLRANHGSSLGSNAVILSGGTLESGVNITRPLGVDAGQLSIASGNSGFSAAGADILVDLSGSGESSNFTLVWGDNIDFLPANFILNAATATHKLTFTNSLDLNGAGRTINVNGSSSRITGSIVGVGGGLTKGGAGVLELAASNSYTAGTTVSGGTLRLAHAQALGTEPANLTVNGATVDLNGYDLSVTALAGNTSGIITDESTTAGTTHLVANNPTGTSTFTGAILDGTNGRVLSFEKAGGATLVLNKANAHHYTGGTFLSGGRLDVRTNNAQVLPLNGEVTFKNTATFVAANNTAGAAASITLGNFKLLAGEATIESNKLNATALNGTLTLAAAPIRSSGATGNFTLANTTDPSLFKVVLTNAPTAGQAINGGLYFGGSSFATWDASGYVRALNYAGDQNAALVSLSASQATLGSVFGKDVQLAGGTNAITAQSSDSIRSLKLSGQNQLTLDFGATLTLSSGGLLAAGGNAVISGGAGIAADAGADLVIRVDGATDVLTLDTAITAASTGGLTKSGNGILFLNGANAFTGGLWVNGGTLNLGATGTLPQAGAVTLNTGSSLLVNGTLSGATEVYAKSGSTLGGTGSIAAQGVTLDSGAFLKPGASAGTLSFALGTGDLDLSAATAGSLKFELGTVSDHVRLTSGTLTLGDNFDLSAFEFTNAGGFGPGTYVLFETTSNITGDLGSYVTGDILGLEATLSFGNGSGGRDDVLLTVVPEPGSAALLLGGLGLLTGFRRRRS